MLPLLIVLWLDCKSLAFKDVAHSTDSLQVPLLRIQVVGAMNPGAMRSWRLPRGSEPSAAAVGRDRRPWELRNRRKFKNSKARLEPAEAVKADPVSV